MATPGCHNAPIENGGDDASHEKNIGQAADREMRRAFRAQKHLRFEISAREITVDQIEDDENEARGEEQMRPQRAQRPEEADAAQKAEKQRRIAERRQDAADVGDEKDKEDDDMRLMLAFRIGLQNGADEDQRRARRADEARSKSAEGKKQRVQSRRRAIEIGNDDAAGGRIKRKQHQNEGQIVREHAVAKGLERRRKAFGRNQQAQRQAAPRRRPPSHNAHAKPASRKWARARSRAEARRKAGPCKAEVARLQMIGGGGRRGERKEKSEPEERQTRRRALHECIETFCPLTRPAVPATLSHKGRRSSCNQCASSQFSAALASTCSGTAS